MINVFSSQGLLRNRLFHQTVWGDYFVCVCVCGGEEREVENVLTASNASGQRGSVFTWGCVSSPGMPTLVLPERPDPRKWRNLDHDGVPLGPEGSHQGWRLMWRTEERRRIAPYFTVRAWVRSQPHGAPDKGHKICLFRDVGGEALLWDPRLLSVWGKLLLHPDHESVLLYRREFAASRHPMMCVRHNVVWCT